MSAAVLPDARAREIAEDHGIDAWALTEQPEIIAAMLDYAGECVAAATPPASDAAVLAGESFRMNLAIALFEARHLAKLRGWSNETRDYWLSRADDAFAAAAPKVASDTGAGLRADLAGIRSNFERIAAFAPNDQPHYPSGVRPWGTGDLRHAIETLRRAEEALATLTDATDGAGLREALAKEFRDASRGYGRAGTAEMRDGPYMSMGDAAGVYADLMLSKAASDVGDAFDLDGIKKLWRTGVETGRILQQADTSKAGFSEQAWAEAVRETDRHCYELDITNADHIVLWLEHQLNGHVGPLAYIACRILDAHEAALATDATDGATGGGEVRGKLDAIKQAARYAPVGDGYFDPYGSAAEAVDAAVDRLAAMLATTPGGDLLEQANIVDVVLPIIVQNTPSVGRSAHHVACEVADAVLKALKPAGDGGEA